MKTLLTNLPHIVVSLAVIGAVSALAAVGVVSGSAALAVISVAGGVSIGGTISNGTGTTTP